MRYVLPAVLLATILPVYAQSPAADVPLIERAKIFGNPTKAGARLSPDGQWLSWIAPRDGVLNVWVAPADNLAQARPLTNEKVRPIRSNFWSPDSKVVLFCALPGRLAASPARLAVWPQRDTNDTRNGLLGMLYGPGQKGHMIL